MKDMKIRATKETKQEFNQTVPSVVKQQLFWKYLTIQNYHFVNVKLQSLRKKKRKAKEKLHSEISYQKEIYESLSFESLKFCHNKMIQNCWQTNQVQNIRNVTFERPPSWPFSCRINWYQYRMCGTDKLIGLWCKSDRDPSRDE